MNGSTAPGSRAPGRPEQREAFLAGAVDFVVREGISTLALRPLATALGTSDRMLLYYFGSRERLLISVLTAVGEQLQGQLAAALPAEPVPPVRLLALAWEAMQVPEADPLLRLYIEVSGLAARGREPYRGVAAAVAQGWLDWVAERLAVPLDERRVAASGVLAMLDGLLLVRFVASPEAAADAAGWLTGAWTAGP